MKKNSAKRIVMILLGLVAAGAIYFSVKEYLYYQHHEDTEDAQIDGNITPISARVGGYVQKIWFEDNQLVHKGDTLVTIDPTDYTLQVAQAKAALETAIQGKEVASSTIATQTASLASAKANVEQAQTKYWKASKDFDRYQNLLKEQAITESQFEEAKTGKDAASAALKAAKAQYSVLINQINTSKQQVKVAEAKIEAQKAALAQAQQQVKYTHIVAPSNGIVSKRNIEVGQLVQQGQSLFALVDNIGLYVTANFKETQLTNIKVGEKVDVEVDAYPNDEVKGVVGSFSGATGAKFSLLPPDNATGNFVKVVQRVPVRIELNCSKEVMQKLRPGLSVKVSVNF